MLALPLSLLLAASGFSGATASCSQNSCRYDMDVRTAAQTGDEPLSFPLPADLTGFVAVTLFDNDAKLMGVRVDVPEDNEEVEIPDGVDLADLAASLELGKYWTCWVSQEGQLYRLDLRWAFENKDGNRTVVLYLSAKNKTKR